MILFIFKTRKRNKLVLNNAYLVHILHTSTKQNVPFFSPTNSNTAYKE